MVSRLQVNSHQRPADGNRHRLFAVHQHLPVFTVGDRQQQGSLALRVNRAAQLISVGLHIFQLAAGQRVHRCLIGIVGAGIYDGGLGGSLIHGHRKLRLAVSIHGIDHVEMIRVGIVRFRIFRRSQLQLIHPVGQIQVHLLVIRHMDAVGLAVLHINVPVQHVDGFPACSQLHKLVLHIHGVAR